jgi:hypothetical protein
VPHPYQTLLDSIHKALESALAGGNASLLNKNPNLFSLVKKLKEGVEKEQKTSSST